MSSESDRGRYSVMAVALVELPPEKTDEIRRIKDFIQRYGTEGVFERSMEELVGAADLRLLHAVYDVQTRDLIAVASVEFRPGGIPELSAVVVKKPAFEGFYLQRLLLIPSRLANLALVTGLDVQPVCVPTGARSVRNVESTHFKPFEIFPPALTGPCQRCKKYDARRPGECCSKAYYLSVDGWRANIEDFLLRTQTGGRAINLSHRTDGRQITVTVHIRSVIDQQCRSHLEELLRHRLAPVLEQVG